MGASKNDVATQNAFTPNSTFTLDEISSSTGFPPPPFTSCMFEPSEPCESYKSAKVAQLKEEVATLKRELQSFKGISQKYSQSTIHSPDVPHLRSRLFQVKMEQQFLEQIGKVYRTAKIFLQKDSNQLGARLFNERPSGQWKRHWVKKLPQFQFLRWVESKRLCETFFFEDFEIIKQVNLYCANWRVNI